jgi:hypothetical protein
MLDHKSIVSGIFSYFSITLGLITLNNIAILVGIMSGLSVIISNVYGMYLKNKEFKRNKDNVDRTSK